MSWPLWSCAVKLLSTPHGTLGTDWEKNLDNNGRMPTFNSTRYIKNFPGIMYIVLIKPLSTPHGTLGTELHHVAANKVFRVLSTPHGTLGTRPLCAPQGVDIRYIFQLHTIH